MWRAVSVSFRGARRFSAAAAAQPAVRLVLQRKKLTSTELATAEAAMDAASAEDLKKLLAAGKLTPADLVDCATGLLAANKPDTLATTAALFQAASDAGDLKAQYSWAAMQRLGRGTARNAPAAMHLFKELANKGHGISAFNVGSMQQSGEGTAKDAAAALINFEKAASLGVAAAFVAAGEIYRDGAEGVPVDFAKAHLAFCKAATAGDLHAYIHLARMYQHGQGDVACDKKAFSHTMSAAAFGLPLAQHNIGTFLMSGRGCEADAADAAKYFKLAADQGFTYAQVNLANMYKSGIGVPVDESLALHYYTLAKDRNEHAKAMHDSLLATAVAAPASTSTSTPAKTPGWREKLGRWWND